MERMDIVINQPFQFFERRFHLLYFKAENNTVSYKLVLVSIAHHSMPRLLSSSKFLVKNIVQTANQ